MRTVKDLGFAVPDILIPQEGTDFKKWAVIACDQYTSEPEYWESCEKEVGDAPSTLNLVLPEVYLGTEKETEKLGSIAKTARKYLDEGILSGLGTGFILTDRATELHPSRKGLMAAIDLEGYSFEPGNKNICRATEGTVLSRIPPRVRIRANSPLELPHIMILIDDPKGLTIEKAFDMAKEEGLKPLYDTDLMLGSGHISGTFIPDGTPIAESIVEGLSKLKADNSDGLLFLVGDGNHSLASAKAHWENIRENLSDEDKLTVNRARKVQRFLSQSFSVAEQFTGLEGKYVPLKETIRGFKMILDGECDELPESAFLFCGTIDEAFEKAKK